MLLYESIQRPENTVVMAILFVTAFLMILVNLLTDLIPGIADPRLRQHLNSV